MKCLHLRVFKKFSNGPTPMMWVCKTLLKIRGTQHTSNHCILMRRSEDIVDQSLTPP